MRRTKARRAVLLCAALSGVMPGVAGATARSWLTETSGDFNDGSLWTPSGTPTSADALTISFAANTPFTVAVPTGTTSAAQSLLLNAGAATLDVDGSLTLSSFTLERGKFDGTVSFTPGGTLATGTGVGYLTGTRVFRPQGSLTLLPVAGDAASGHIFGNMDLLMRAGLAGGTSVQLTTGSRSISNAGTLTFDAAPGTTTPTNVTLALGNVTNVLTNTGTLNLLGGSTSSDPIFGNRRVIQSLLLNAGGGVTNIGAGVYADVTSNTSPTTPSTENAGTFNIAATGSYNTATFRQNGGTLNINAGGTLQALRFELLAGPVNGAVTLAQNATLVTAAGISGSGSYRALSSLTIDRPAGSSVGGDVLPGMDVLMRASQPNAGSSSVTLSTNSRPLTNAGTLTLDAFAGSSTPSSVNVSLGLSNNALTNTGTLNLNGGSTSPDPQFGNRRSIQGRLINAAGGTTNIAAGVYADINGTANVGETVVDNSGAISIAGGATLNTFSFRQSAGSLTIAPTAALTTNRFELLTGTVSGAVTLTSSGTLITGGNPTSSGSYRPVSSFTLDRPAGASSGGDIPANTDVLLRASQPTGSSAVTLNTNSRSFTNAGMLTLDALAGTTTPSSVGVSLGLSSNALTNTGTLNFNGGTITSDLQFGNRRTISGRLINAAGGVTAIAAGVYADVNGTANSGEAVVDNSGTIAIAGTGTLNTFSFRQSNGALTIAPTGTLSTNRFELIGGTVSGLVTLTSSGTLITASGTAGSGSYRPQSSLTLDKPAGAASGGDVLANMDLLVRASQPGGSSSVSLSTNSRSFTNAGTLTLDAQPGSGTVSSVQVALGLSSNALTNLGTLNFNAGSTSADLQFGNRRTIGGRLVNGSSGVVNVAASVYAEVIGTAGAGQTVTDNSGVLNIANLATLNTLSFRQSAGSTNIVGGGSLTTNRFEFVGGMVNGDVKLTSSATFATAAGIGGSGAYRPLGSLTIDRLAGASTGGNILEGMDLRVRAAQPSSSSSVQLSTAGRSITNAGLLTLDAQPGVATATTVSVQMAALSNTLTNTGTFNLSAGSTLADPVNANRRQVFGNVTNAVTGVINVAAGVNFQVLGSTLLNDGVINLAATTTAPTNVTNNGTINIAPPPGGLSGPPTIGEPISFIVTNLTNTGVISVGTGATLVVNNTVTGNGEIALNGGSAEFNGPQPAIGSLDTGSGNFAVAAGQTVTADRIRTQDLSIASGGRLNLRPNGTSAAVSRMATLHLNGGAPLGSFDVADNLVVVTATGQFATVLSQRAVTTTVTGLFSTMARANGRLELAIARADQVFPGGSGVLLGEPVAGDDVLIRATLRGDFNLDARVNFDDLVKLAQHYNLAGQGWGDGDTNYDGNVNFDDLVSVAQNYGQSYVGGAIVPSGGPIAANFTADWALAQSLVPEPASLAVVAAAVASVSVRRRAR